MTVRAAAVLALAALLLGCGADESADTQGSADAVTVEMRDLRYQPPTTTLRAGQTVRWINRDPIDHDVKATSGASFQSELFGEGGSYTWTPEDPGTTRYVCTIHPGMRGTITVRG